MLATVVKQKKTSHKKARRAEANETEQKGKDSDAKHKGHENKTT
jgi:hypothetical protein